MNVEAADQVYCRHIWNQSNTYSKEIKLYIKNVLSFIRRSHLHNLRLCLSETGITNNSFRLLSLQPRVNRNELRLSTSFQHPRFIKAIQSTPFFFYCCQYCQEREHQFQNSFHDKILMARHSVQSMITSRCVSTIQTRCVDVEPKTTT